MLKFREYITEVMDSSYPSRTMADNEHTKIVAFKSDSGNKYNVNITKPRTDNHGLEFSPVSAKHKHGILGNEGSSALKVFSTVKKIADQHLKKNPQVKAIHFSADENEPSRVRLYHRLSQSVDPSYEYAHTHGVHFFVLHNPYHKSE